MGQIYINLFIIKKIVTKTEGFLNCRVPRFQSADSSEIEVKYIHIIVKQSESFYILF